VIEGRPKGAKVQIGAELLWKSGGRLQSTEYGVRKDSRAKVGPEYRVQSTEYGGWAVVARGS